jgi:hypothetical protein
MSRGLLKVKIG